MSIEQVITIALAVLGGGLVSLATAFIALKRMPSQIRVDEVTAEKSEAEIAKLYADIASGQAKARAELEMRMDQADREHERDLATLKGQIVAMQTQHQKEVDELRRIVVGPFIVENTIGTNPLTVISTKIYVAPGEQNGMNVGTTDEKKDMSK